jgi:hypothetical protein
VESLVANQPDKSGRVRWKRGYRLKIDIAIVPAVSGMVATVIVLCETRARRAEETWLPSRKTEMSAPRC